MTKRKHAKKHTAKKHGHRTPPRKANGKFKKR